MQTKLRWDACEWRAAPPQHLTFGQWLLVDAEPLSTEGGQVGEDVGAEEHDARLDPRRPLRPADDQAEVRAAFRRRHLQPTLPGRVREVVDLLHTEDLGVEGEGCVLVGDRNHDRRYLPDVRSVLGHAPKTPAAGETHRSTSTPSSVSG